MVKVYEEVMYGSSWVSTSQETIELNSFSYSVPIKLNVSIHNVLARAKRIYLLWRKELVPGCTGGGWLGTSRLLLGAGKGLPFIPLSWSISPWPSECPALPQGPAGVNTVRGRTVIEGPPRRAALMAGAAALLSSVAGLSGKAE